MTACAASPSRDSCRDARSADWCQRRSPRSGIAVVHFAQLWPGILFQRIARVRIPRSEIGQLALVAKCSRRKCAAKTVPRPQRAASVPFPWRDAWPVPTVHRECPASSSSAQHAGHRSGRQASAPRLGTRSLQSNLVARAESNHRALRIFSPQEGGGGDDWTRP